MAHLAAMAAGFQLCSPPEPRALSIVTVLPPPEHCAKPWWMPWRQWGNGRVISILTVILYKVAPLLLREITSRCTGHTNPSMRQTYWALTSLNGARRPTRWEPLTPWGEYLTQPALEYIQRNLFEGWPALSTTPVFVLLRKLKFFTICRGKSSPTAGVSPVMW